MDKIDIARAWKDEEYRNSLSQEELAQLPVNPAGLSDEELEEVHGAEMVAVSYKGIDCGSIIPVICPSILGISCPPDTKDATKCPPPPTKSGPNCPPPNTQAGTCAVNTAGCCSAAGPNGGFCPTVLSGTCNATPVPVAGL